MCSYVFLRREWETETMTCVESETASLILLQSHWLSHLIGCGICRLYLKPEGAVGSSGRPHQWTAQEPLTDRTKSNPEYWLQLIVKQRVSEDQFRSLWSHPDPLHHWTTADWFFQTIVLVPIVLPLQKWIGFKKSYWIIDVQSARWTHSTTDVTYWWTSGSFNNSLIQSSSLAKAALAVTD